MNPERPYPPDIFSMNLESKKREEIVSSLERERQGEHERISYEIEKTPENLTHIEFLNSILNTEIQNLGLSPRKIEASQIHFLKKISKEAKSKLEDNLGIAFVDTQGTWINLPALQEVVRPYVDYISDEEYRRDVDDYWFEEIEELAHKKSEILFYGNDENISDEGSDRRYEKAAPWEKRFIDKTLRNLPTMIKKQAESLAIDLTTLHEMIHIQGALRIWFDEDEDVWDVDRTGFRITNRKSGEMFLRSLNEAVVEKMTREMYVAAKERIPVQPDEKEILDAIGLRPSGMLHDIIEAAGSYSEEIKVLDLVLSGIAEWKGVSEQDVWGIFKKEYFTGKLFFLRDIERVFGKGSLRMLASADKSTIEERLRYFSNRKGESPSSLTSLDAT